jgi:glutamate-1-semialdehyde 2,1-aminomutase
MPSLVVSYAHTDADIDCTVAAIDQALAVYRQALDHGVDRYLVGRPSQTVYRAYNLPEVRPRTEDLGARQLAEAR